MFSRVLYLIRQSAWMLVPPMPIGDAYTRRDAFNDIIAGATVATVLIPQAIAYALLAGLPPAHGLYAALVGGIAGSLWSSSRFLATGPIAILSLLTLSAIAPFATPGSGEYVALVATLAVLVGVVQIVMGLSRLGFIIRLVPLSVLVGFSSAGALVIAITQIPNLLGFTLSQSSYALEQVARIAVRLPELNWPTLVVGVATLAALVVMRSISSKIPGNIIVLAGGIVASIVLDLPSYNVAVAGDIPVRLPISELPSLSISLILTLGGHAFILALVGFMSAYSTVKEFSQRTRERIDADQELIGQGFANLFSGLFRGYPVGGSLSRTAVNFDAGAKTAWSGVYASFLIVLAIFFFSPALAQLPNAVVAAILVFAVVPLVDIKELRRIYGITRTDGVIGVVTFIAVFFMRMDQAVLLGVVLALVLYMRKVMLVHVNEVGFHPQWRSLVSKTLFPDAETFPRMLMLRIDAPIFYANVERLESEINERLEEFGNAERGSLKVVALDFSGVNHMDVTGVEGFADIVRSLHERSMQVFVLTARRGIREILERGNLGGRVRFVHGNRELRLIGEASLEGKSLV